ncbi:OST-HTH/LOTUS domain-containing protein [Microbacterium oleivorans]|uniref:OST-HTH/LOTUS domain-containing protein n=1 Tax=Microbacterium oleivorans TaxID=273677 RepID=UPI00268A997E
MEQLLSRALRLEHVRTDEEWVHLSAVKNLMKRMDPSFSEKAHGHRSFSDFVKDHPKIAELDETTNIVRVRAVESA